MFFNGITGLSTLKINAVNVAKLILQLFSLPFLVWVSKDFCRILRILLRRNSFPHLKALVQKALKFQTIFPVIVIQRTHLVTKITVKLTIL